MRIREGAGGRRKINIQDCCFEINARHGTRDTERRGRGGEGKEAKGDARVLDPQAASFLSGSSSLTNVSFSLWP
jgi:hypothetical protein